MRCVRGWLPVMLGVWGLALALRLAFAAQVVGQNTPGEIRDLNWDSREYVHLAQDLARTGRYGTDTAESRFFALLRTPGYPAFCALVFKLGGGVPAIVYTQAVLGSLVPVLVFVLAGMIFRDRRWAGAAGMLSAVSTTGIGLSGMLLADGPFALALLGGFVCIVLAAAQGRRWAAPAAALGLGAAVLCKPALFYAGPFLAGTWWLLARSQGRPVRWGRLAWVLLVPLLVMAGWSARNRAVTGHWVYSTVDAQNLRHFMAPMTEELADAGWPPDLARLRARHEQALVRDLREVTEGRISAPDLAARQRAEAGEVLWRHPLRAASALATCSALCTNDGWWYTPYQVRAPGIFRDLMQGLNLLQIGLHLPGLGLALLAWFEARLARRMRGSWLRADGAEEGQDGAGAGAEARRREALALAAVGVVFLYFFAIAGTSFSTGFRIMYPVEFAMILLGLGGARAAVRLSAVLAAPPASLPALASAGEEEEEPLAGS